MNKKTLEVWEAMTKELKVKEGVMVRQPGIIALMYANGPKAPMEEILEGFKASNLIEFQGQFEKIVGYCTRIDVPAEEKVNVAMNFMHENKKYCAKFNIHSTDFLDASLIMGGFSI